MKFNLQNTNNKSYWAKIKKMKPKQKLCFIHTPKCGGTYARQILKDLKIKNKRHNLAKKKKWYNFYNFKTSS